MYKDMKALIQALAQEGWTHEVISSGKHRWFHKETGTKWYTRIAPPQANSRSVNNLVSGMRRRVADRLSSPPTTPTGDLFMASTSPLDPVPLKFNNEPSPEPAVKPVTVVSSTLDPVPLNFDEAPEEEPEDGVEEDESRQGPRLNGSARKVPIEPLLQFLKRYKVSAADFSQASGYTRGMVPGWIRRGDMPIIAHQLMRGWLYDHEPRKVVRRTSRAVVIEGGTDQVQTVVAVAANLRLKITELGDQ